MTIWPDHDQPGADFARLVAELANEAGGTTVSIVAVPAEFPEGGTWPTSRRPTGPSSGCAGCSKQHRPGNRKLNLARARRMPQRRMIRVMRGDIAEATEASLRVLAGETDPFAAVYAWSKSFRAADTYPRSPGRRGNSPTDGGAHPARCGRRLAVSASGATRGPARGAEVGRSAGAPLPGGAGCGAVAGVCQRSPASSRRRRSCRLAA